MFNKQNTRYISFLADERRRISLWKQIKLVYKLVRQNYWIVRSGKRRPHQKVEKNLKHLKAILKNLILPPINPYQYWVNRQLSINTNGMKFHTKWYEIDINSPIKFGVKMRQIPY